MHLLHFLLFVSITFGGAQTPPKYSDPMCGTNRKCLVPLKCFNPTSTTNDAINVVEGMNIEANCMVMAKFRVFTKKKWLMRLESLDPEVTKMEFGQGNVNFECEKVNSVVSATYNSEEKKLISSTPTPLMCEYLVSTDTADVMPTGKGVVLSFSKEGQQPTQFTLRATAFQDHIIPLCDPNNVKNGIVGSHDAMMILNVKEKENSMDLICPDGYTMTFQPNGGDAKREEASSIQCKDNNDGIFGYSISTQEGKNKFFPGELNARCERLKCEMCSTILPKPNCAKTSIFKIENEANSKCQQLKCISGKIKIDDSMNRPPYAPCKYINGQHVFAVHSTFGNHDIIDDNANVQCIEKEICDTKERQLAEKACEDCVMDRYNQPACSKGTTLTLKRSADDIRVNVYCDDSKGELVWRAVDSAGAEHRLMESEKLYCALPPKPKAPDCSAFFTQAQMDENRESGSLPWKISTGVLLLVIVGLLGVGCWMYARPPACKRRHKRDEFDTIKVEDLRDSKESKKEETSHTGRDVTPVEAQKPALSSPLGTTADQSGTKTSRAVAEDGKTAESATKSSRTFRSEEGNKKKKPSTGGASAVKGKPNKEA